MFFSPRQGSPTPDWLSCLGPFISLNFQIIWLSNILALSGVVCTKFDIYDFIM